MMYPAADLVFVAAPLVTVRLTLKAPAVEYVCDGFSLVEVLPSPKSQLQEVGEPVDVSVKVTASGAVPDFGVPVKFAVSGSVTVI
jgi:hypothetical protein